MSSLVAYGASDDEDSDSNDSAHDQPQALTHNGSVPKTKQESLIQTADSAGHISDEDDYVPTSALKKSEPEPSPGYISDEEEYKQVSSTSASKILFSSAPEIDLLAKYVNESKSSEDDNTASTSLESLPAPKKNDDVLAEGDLEDEVKPKAREIADAPKPPPKKTRQPVKITIPSLDDTPADEVESNKKATATNTTTKKTGLFSLLPAPIHSAKKEINRPLIPHTLGKKSAAPRKAPPISSGTPAQSTPSSGSEDLPSKRMSQFNALTGFDSDSDEDNEDQSSTVNFFSIDSTSKSMPSTTAKLSQIVAESPSSKPVVLKPSRVQSQKISSSKDDSPQKVSKPVASTRTVLTNPTPTPIIENAEEGSVVESGPEPGAVNDAPLDFGVGRSVLSGRGMQGSHSYLSPVCASGPSTTVYNGAASASAMYNMAYQGSMEVAGEDDDALAVSSNDFQSLVNDKEFQRLHGKRKREEISFVDANVDDYVDPSEVSKHLTEETEYVSHKNKDNMPTSQQKRKKQITYLAFQAKEKELELKNQWSQNRHTKKQTQSKYGF